MAVARRRRATLAWTRIAAAEPPSVARIFRSAWHAHNRWHNNTVLHPALRLVHVAEEVTDQQRHRDRAALQRAKEGRVALVVPARAEEKRRRNEELARKRRR